MNLPLLAFRNVRRNRLRTVLTIAGVMIAMLAFGFLRTVIHAYYAGAEAAKKDRLVVRNATSLVVPLPLGYKQKIKQIPGVREVAAAQWFGATYKDPRNFFPQFAVDDAYLDLYPEFQVTPEERKAWNDDPQGCIIGRKTAEKYGFKIGDVVPLTGTIFSGDWHFNVRGIYRGAERNTDETGFMFHWKYLMDSQPTEMQGDVGMYMIGITDASRSAEIAKTVDAQFKGSPYETLTEDERSFQMSFLSMVSVIVGALQVVSAFVIVIVLLILGNTIAMSVRERGSEVAILKALGFSGGRLAMLITVEAMVLALLGGLVGIAVALPFIGGVGKALQAQMGGFLPVFYLTNQSMLMMVGLALGMGFLGALIPAMRTAQLSVVEAMRRVG
jgi:putative ABC transport system permease protein